MESASPRRSPARGTNRAKRKPKLVFVFFAFVLAFSVVTGTATYAYDFAVFTSLPIGRKLTSVHENDRLGCSGLVTSQLLDTVPGVGLFLSRAPVLLRLLASSAPSGQSSLNFGAAPDDATELVDETSPSPMRLAVRAIQRVPDTCLHGMAVASAGRGPYPAHTPA